MHTTSTVEPGCRHHHRRQSKRVTTKSRLCREHASSAKDEPNTTARENEDENEDENASTTRSVRVGTKVNNAKSRIWEPK